MKENRQQRLEWLKKNRPNDPQLAKLRARKQGQPMPGPQPNIVTAANPVQRPMPGFPLPTGVRPQQFSPEQLENMMAKFNGPPAMPNPQINGVNNPLKQGQLPHGQDPRMNGVNNPLKLGQQPHGQNPMWNGVNNPLKAQGPMNPAAAAPTNPGLEEAARQVALQQVPYRR